MRTCPRALLFTAALLLSADQPAYSQIFSFGIKGGMPLSDAYSTAENANLASSSYDRRYLVGPTAEVHLPLHFSLELDALYRRNGFMLSGVSFVGIFPDVQTIPFSNSAAVNDWQFPLLAKYEFKSGSLRPFVDGGVVYRHVSAHTFTASSPNSAGVAVGVGLTLKLLSFRISPEIRYSYLPTEPYTNTNTITVSSTKSQADLMVGITF